MKKRIFAFAALAGFAAIGLVTARPAASNENAEAVTSRKVVARFVTVNRPSLYSASSGDGISAMIAISAEGEMNAKSGDGVRLVSGTAALQLLKTSKEAGAANWYLYP